MQFTRFLILLAIAITVGSCNKDDEGSLTLHFLARNAGNPLEMLQTVDINGEDIQFSHLSMLISDLKLLTATGSHSLREIDLVDLSFDDPTSASEGFTIHIDNIPANTYTGISFGIGVPADLNSQTPSDFPSSNPLSRTSYYWEAWDSYIFMKTEGKIDTIAPLDFETGFAYHTGSDDLYRILQTNFPLSIIDGMNEDLSIAIDYSQILNGIDIASKPQNHNPEDSIQILKIVNNLQTAITLFQ